MSNRLLVAALFAVLSGLGAARTHATSAPMLLTESARAEGVVINAELSPVASVADVVWLRMETIVSDGATIEWPSSLVVGGEIAGMTVADMRLRPTRIDEAGRLVERREFDLQPFLPGEIEIGPFEFVIIRDGGVREPLTLEPITMSITGLLPLDGPVEFAGPKGVVDAPEEAADDLTLLIVGGSAAVVLCAAAGTLIALRWRGSESTESPSRRALTALAILETAVRGEGNVGQRPTNERAYTELSSILRTYIEGRFEYRATARTTEEFLRDASGNRAGGLPADAAEQLRVVLEACDEVKFAGAEPGMAAAGRAIDEVRGFVESFGDADEEDQA